MKQWYALRSKPKREMAAADMLSRASIDVYVPQMAVQKLRGRPPVFAPFFPGYFFAHLDPECGEIQMARYTVGVLDVVGYGGAPWPVDDALVMAIKDRLSCVDGVTAIAGFKQGDRVLITSGPFRDAEAVFDRRLSPNGRVRVFIRMLQRMCPAEIFAGYLRRANQVA